MTKLDLLIPLDGTGFSRQILPTVKQLFKPDHYRVKLLHVATPPSPFNEQAIPSAIYADASLYVYPLTSPARIHPLDEDDNAIAYKKELEEELEGDFASLGSDGYEVEVMVVFGDPLTEIVKIANDNPVDVIAIASHDRNPLNRFFVGSIARKVQDAVSYPVLFVKLEDNA